MAQINSLHPRLSSNTDAAMPTTRKKRPALNLRGGSKLEPKQEEAASHNSRMSAKDIKKLQEFVGEEVQRPSYLSEIINRLEESPAEPAKISKGKTHATRDAQIFLNSDKDKCSSESETNCQAGHKAENAQELHEDSYRTSM